VKIIDCIQGSEEWKKARLGRPTASQFSRILTPKQMKLSATSVGYLHELVAERYLGMPLDPAFSEWIERGTAMESQARTYYEMQRDVQVREVGHVLTDDEKVGASPDGLVGDDGGLEIKVPSAKVHIGYLLDGTDSLYKSQVQGCMWVCERKWWDVLSYNPTLQPVLMRVQRDEEYIEKLSAAVAEFCKRLEFAMERMENIK